MANVGFEEIAGDLRSRIEHGADDWVAGRALPSENQLATEWGVTRTTIRRALGVLESENLIRVVPGRGRFIRSDGDSSHQPAAKYERVAAILREEVSDLAKGHQLDSEVRLAARFKVAYGTIRQALSLLANEGLIGSAHGQGWFVGLENSSTNLTDKVFESLRAAIDSGAIPTGERLAGELVLASEYKVARVTVRRALAKLEADGLIENRSGKGRFVVERQKPESVKGVGA